MADEDNDLEFDLDDVKPPPSQDAQDQDGQDGEDQDGGGEQDRDQVDDQGADDNVDASPDRSSQSRAQDSNGASRPSRRETRISTLLEERRADRQRIDELNRRIDGLLTQRSQPQGESREQRDARRALMTAEERMQDILHEDRQTLRGEMQTMQFTMLENQDKATFDNLCASNKKLGRFKDAVEKELATLRQQGLNASREKVLRYVLGDELIKNMGSGESRRQRQDGERRVRQQSTRPSNTRSDQQSDRQQRTSLERRLENVSI